MANKMTKDVFAKSLVELLQEDGIIVELTNIDKVNFSYTGLILHNTQNDGDTRYKASAIANVDDLYKTYLDDVAIAEIIETTKEILKNEDLTPNTVEYENLLDWEFVKDKLFLQVCNATANVEYLRDKVYDTVEDLAIVAKVLVYTNEQGVYSAPVTQSMLSHYNVSQQTFMMAAKASSIVLFPSVIYNTGDVNSKIYEQLRKSGVPEFVIQQAADDMSKNSPIKMIVTNTTAMYGAASIFYDGIMEQISAAMGGDYYIVPSSIHEFLILSTTDCDGEPLDIENVESVINDVNKMEDCVQKDDILSGSLYMYRGGRFVKA